MAGAWISWIDCGRAVIAAITAAPAWTHIQAMEGRNSMGGKGSGRKPLPDSGKRVRLSVEIAPQTYAGLCREGARERMAMGRLLDKIWKSHTDKNTH